MFIFLIFCIGLVECQYFNDSIFTTITETQNLSNVKIANFYYSAINNVEFCFLPKSSAMPITNGIYPYEPDLPRIKPNRNLNLKNIIRTENTINVIRKIENLINKNDFIQGSPSFNITGGISILRENENQVLLVWDSKRTFLILIKPESIQKEFTITLGRGLVNSNFFNNLPSYYSNQTELIFEISTNTLVKYGCQQIITSNGNETIEIPLSLSKYKLKNLGGEKIFIQGPCLNNLETVPNLEIRSVNNPNLTIPSVSLEIQNNSFILLTPCLWYTGLYQFKLPYRNYNFISYVEIYSIDGDNSNIQIEEIEEMNNPNYNKKYFTLKISNYITSMKFSFYTSDLKNNDQNQIPFKLVKSNVNVLTSGGIIQIDFSYILEPQINIYEQIGFIGYIDQSNETKWTNSFSLIWMKKFVSNIKDSHCETVMSKSVIEEILFCPEKLKQASGLLSTFRILSSNTDYFSSYNQGKDCFSQVLINKKETGITCCYDNTTKNLVYGQDFYLRNKSLFGSYTWTISPFYDVLKHFIHDRIPLHSCCSLINNEYLCYEFWNKYHSIKIKTYKEDLRADVFGDPHFIPYKSLSKYSFLGSGDFHLILTKNNEFNLQGRFFYYDSNQIKSLLKAIAFKILSIHMSITTSSISKTDLHWKILIETQNRSLIESLPFQHDNLFIFQSSDTTKLHIYLKLLNDYQIYIELERNYMSNDVLEYINMKVHLSNNMKHIIIGGLFGRIDNNTKSTWLYIQNSSDPIPRTDNDSEMFTFSNTWKLTDDKNLFFDSNLNWPNHVFVDPGLNTDQCHGLKMCQIDKYNYGRDQIYQKTFDAHESRIKLDDEWKSLLYESKVCDHPLNKKVKFNSDNFTESSKIYIIGCVDPNKTVGIENPSMECKSNLSVLFWKLNFQNEICQKTKPTDKILVAGNEIVYAGIGVLILILIILCVIVAFFLLRRKRRLTSNTKNDIELTTSNMTLETTYDTASGNIDNIGQDDEYSVYSQIQKCK